MNKKNLVDRLAVQAPMLSMPKWEVEKIVNIVLAEIVDEVTTMRHGKHGEAKFIGFGTFRTKVRKARTGRSLITGEKIYIPKKTVVEFRPGHRFRDRLNLKKVHAGI